MPLSTLDQAPLKKALLPSSRAIFFQQSMVPVYMMSAEGEETESQMLQPHLNRTVGGKKEEEVIL